MSPDAAAIIIPNLPWIIGGGLAGCEAAWQLAQRGKRVLLHEMRPERGTAAHQGDGLALGLVLASRDIDRYRNRDFRHQVDGHLVDSDGLDRLGDADLAAGHRPFCVLGKVGTVNTGAIDDVAALRELSDEKMARPSPFSLSYMPKLVPLTVRQLNFPELLDNLLRLVSFDSQL